MLAKIVKKCEICRTELFVEKASEVYDRIEDGRRVISVRCLVCGANREVLRKLKRRT